MEDRVSPTVLHPNVARTALFQLSVGVFVDRDVSNCPSLATIRTNKVARTTSGPKSLAVIGIGNVHDQGCVEIMVLRDGAAFNLLAFHG